MATRDHNQNENTCEHQKHWKQQSRTGKLSGAAGAVLSCVPAFFGEGSEKGADFIIALGQILHNGGSQFRGFFGVAALNKSFQKRKQD